MGDEYKIQVFDAETQNLLKTALKDPSSVDLEKVANVIVEQSLRDATFSKESGKMCYTIIQAESKESGRSIFRSSLLNRLQTEYRNREEMRARSVQEWVCYVSFICNIFDYLRVSHRVLLLCEQALHFECVTLCKWLCWMCNPACLPPDQ
ncbi:hypothetical protein GDO81_012645 [Engystomops pustulosus]|uniref:MIF4G domain-containing protein n=1 Tax=Engystomops pustulosus TaxID=76066 RepID=A0AAV7AUP3_ENGPU|nr:hypothetical protein GDO81_012645 [Engystomops pustulosus]